MLLLARPSDLFFSIKLTFLLPTSSIDANRTSPRLPANCDPLHSALVMYDTRDEGVEGAWIEQIGVTARRGRWRGGKARWGASESPFPSFPLSVPAPD